MVQRLALLTITLFWVAMNVLLWRSEFGGPAHPGSPVPTSVVWRKILTAPDNSSLEIVQNGERIGYCRWSAAVGRTIARKWLNYDVPPEDAGEAITDYEIDVEGNALVSEVGEQLRFDLGVRFDKNHAWQELNLRLNLRPSRWEIHSRAGERKVRLRVEDEDGQWEREISFATLQDPEALARELKVPEGLVTALMLGLGAPKPDRDLGGTGLKWEAHDDWLSIGHTAVRAYRLETHVLGRYPIVVMISRVGEVLRVDLPGGLVLLNDQLDL